MRLVGHRAFDTFRNLVHDRIRITKIQRQLLAGDLATITNTEQFHFDLEAFRDADDHRVHKTANQTMVHLHLAFVVRTLHVNRVPVLFKGDPGRHRVAQRALRARHFHGLARNLQLNG